MAGMSAAERPGAEMASGRSVCFLQVNIVDKK